MTDILKAYRLKNKLKQVEVARLVGCSKATYSKVECGIQQPKAKLLIKLLKLTVPGLQSQYDKVDAEAELYLQSLRGRVRVD